ncbi:MAG: hypothetical protein K2X98_04710 [Alphaproteobacteria bacterium]|nr:hypothetical protein [Alphaproteobacteria bacterium]
MFPCGDLQVVHFGKEERAEGYTLFSGYFILFSKNAYINIFSCNRIKRIFWMEINIFQKKLGEVDLIFIELIIVVLLVSEAVLKEE